MHPFMLFTICIHYAFYYLYFAKSSYGLQDAESDAVRTADGPEEDAVTGLVADLTRPGYTKLLVKSEDERSFVGLCNEVFRCFRI